MKSVHRPTAILQLGGAMDDISPAINVISSNMKYAICILASKCIRISVIPAINPQAAEETYKLILTRRFRHQQQHLQTPRGLVFPTPIRKGQKLKGGET